MDIKCYANKMQNQTYIVHVYPIYNSLHHCVSNIGILPDVMCL